MKNYLTHLSFNKVPFDPEGIHPHLNYDNPIDQEAARPLFLAGVLSARLTSFLKGYSSKSFMIGNYHSLYLHLQGEMSVIFGDKKHSLCPGELFYRPPGIPCKYVGKDGVPTRCLYIQLRNTSVWEPLKKGGSFIKGYDSAELMFILLRRILDAKAIGGEREMAIARGDANMLATVLRRLRGPLNHSPQGIALSSLHEKIMASVADDWTVKRMCKEIYVSRSTLRRLFQKGYGTTPMEMVIKARIERAAELLTNTSDTLATIAERVGYQSVYSFSRLFSKRMCISPGRYRILSRLDYDLFT